MRYGPVFSAPNSWPGSPASILVSGGIGFGQDSLKSLLQQQ